MDNKICMNILKAISNERSKTYMISANLKLTIDICYYRNIFKINKPNSIEIYVTKIIGENTIHKHNRRHCRDLIRKKGGVIPTYID